ncbi:B-cell receptor-associated protein 31 [Eupeodes corollae]|uniref:B-cell receptor-associated protein 31 n=1 Tax=Eupeodes corollae TaxID=290404 RepID=UPI00249268D6|nr:B-cell receptor-associated protein 31 [Eupeodes corollae]
MSLVWTLIASFLYAEIVVVLLLVLPVASPYRWQRFFKSRFLAMLGKQAHTYFFLLLGVLVLFLLEAIREMRKYSNTEPAGEMHLNVEMQHSMRLFRAQRNFYISGFAIFLVLVIRRLVTLISAQASLLAQSEASLKQAQSASDAARNLMSSKPTEKAKEAKEEAGSNNTVTEITDLRKRVQDLTASLNKEKKDKEAIKSQAESLNREYDRLTEEYSKLQKKVTISGGEKND